MPDRRKRSRHTVPGVLVPVLRLLGWRYSPARNAWVHRIGGGRRGPVFRDHVQRSITAAPVDVHQIDRDLVPEAPADRPELPRRGAPTEAEAGAVEPGATEPDDDAIDLADPLSLPHLTAVEGADDPAEPEAPRVDGRPPRRDRPGTFRSAKPTLRVG